MKRKTKEDLLQEIERLRRRIGKLEAEGRSLDKEEPLRATEQQLRASNQQLNASNQQLRAAEHQLRASNQQLAATNQQLKAAETALRDSEQAARALMDATTDAAMLIDLEGKALALNDQLARRMGRAREELIGLNIYNLLPPDIAERRRSWVREVARTGKRREEEDEREGIILHNVMHPLFDQKGRVNRVAVFSGDITERKRAEEALRQSEETFRALAENANDGVLVATGSGAHVFANKRVAEITGYTIAELLNTTLKDLAHPDEIQRISESYAKRLAGERILSQYETAIKDKSGRRVEVELGAAKMLWHGQPADLVIIRDITDRKRAQDALAASNQQLEAANQQLRATGQQLRASNQQLEAGMERLAEAQSIARLGSWEFDVVKDVISGSDEFYRLFGAGHEQLRTYQAFLDLLHPDDREHVGRDVRESLAKKALYDTEYRIRMPGGDYRHIHARGRVFADDAGKAVRMVGTCLDITERKRVEEELRESGRKFHETVRYLDEGYYSCTIEGEVLEHNIAFNRILGFELAQNLKGAKLPDFWQNPDDRKAYLVELMSRGFVRNFLIDAKTIRGEKLIVMANSHLVKDEKGKPARIEGIFTDFTERMGIEAALRVSEAKYRALFENAEIGMYRTKLDGSAFLDVNRKFAEILGCSLGDLVETPGRIRWADADERDRMLRVLKARGGVLNAYETRVLAMNGDVRDVLASIVLHREEDYLEGTMVDITERKMSEKALIIRNRIADVFLTVPDEETYAEVLKIVLEVMQSPYGVFGYIDEAGALVIPSMTRHIWDKCHIPEKTITFPRDKWGDSSWCRAIREERANYANRESVNTPEGHINIRRHISLPILFRGKAIGLLQVANKETDYTEADLRALETISGIISPVLDARLKRARQEEELKKALADLTRSNKELEQFAYIASHDLQEPLRMVSSYTQLFAQRYKDQLDDKAEKYIAYAVDGTVRMQRLINDLLTYSRVGTRGKPFEPTDSHSVLGEVLRNLQAAIDESRAIITNDDLPTLRTDASQLVQVFQNLIANAIKFRAEAPPRIHVSARDQGREWLFSISDNGIGIDPQYKERVFAIFQRLHTKQEYPGTGIGLALCKKIVERHGGRIWFESEPGKGSTFFFTLPK